MVILGLLLVLLALGLGTLLVLATNDPDVAGRTLEIQFLNVTVELSPLALVVAGMIAMALLWFGLWAIRSALARKSRQRKDRKEQERLARERTVERERQRAAEKEAHDRGVEEQRVATQTARERAEVAEERAARLESDGPKDTGRTAGDRTRPIETRDDSAR